MTKHELTLIPDRPAVVRRSHKASDAAQQKDLLTRLLAAGAPDAPSARMATRLLAQHGSVARVLSASDARLQSVPHMTEALIAYLRLAQEIAVDVARKRLDERAILSSWREVMAYCRATMAHCDVEEVRVFFLNRKNHLIADERHSRGTVDHAPFYPREVIKRALELNACALIVVHNHPSGDPKPSTGDVALTKQLQQATIVMGLTLHDHLIITPNAEFSFRAEGLI